MFNFNYTPIVSINDIGEAMTQRFGRTIEASELFEEPHRGTCMYYSLDISDKALGQMEPLKANTYMFMKAVINKDFNVHTAGVLIEIP